MRSSWGAHDNHIQPPAKIPIKNTFSLSQTLLFLTSSSLPSPPPPPPWLPFQPGDFYLLPLSTTLSPSPNQTNIPLRPFAEGSLPFPSRSTPFLRPLLPGPRFADPNPCRQCAISPVLLSGSGGIGDGPGSSLVNLPSLEIWRWTIIMMMKKLKLLDLIIAAEVVSNSNIFSIKLGLSSVNWFDLIALVFLKLLNTIRLITPRISMTEWNNNILSVLYTVLTTVIDHEIQGLWSYWIIWLELRKR